MASALFRPCLLHVGRGRVNLLQRIHVRFFLMPPSACTRPGAAPHPHVDELVDEQSEINQSDSAQRRRRARCMMNTHRKKAPNLTSPFVGNADVVVTRR